MPHGCAVLMHGPAAKDVALVVVQQNLQAVLFADLPARAAEAVVPVQRIPIGGEAAEEAPLRPYTP